MGLFDKFKKAKTPESVIPPTYTSEIEYNGTAIEIENDVEESKKHLADDYATLNNHGINRIIIERFIPWLKADVFNDRDDKLIYEGLSIYGITYRYGKICAKYSPTQKDENIGQFDFYFNSANEYTSDMLESVAMQIYVLHGEIVKVDGYEV